eukprot:scaffold26875_cov101-Isochrysis_galbana.AAC.2
MDPDGADKDDERPSVKRAQGLDTNDLKRQRSEIREASLNGEQLPCQWASPIRLPCRRPRRRAFARVGGAHAEEARVVPSEGRSHPCAHGRRWLAQHREGLLRPRPPVRGVSCNSWSRARRPHQFSARLGGRCTRAGARSARVDRGK